MNFDPTITVGNLLAILSAVIALIGIVWKFNNRIIKVEGVQDAHLSRIEALEAADEALRNELRAVRSEAGAQFKALQDEIRRANEYVHHRLDTIFMRLGAQAASEPAR